MQLNNINLAKQTKSEFEDLQNHVFDHIQQILDIDEVEKLDNFTRKELEEKTGQIAKN